MNILVTGGAGFIGSNFVKYMLDKYPDYNITNLDKLTYAGNLENLRNIESNQNYTFVKGDICDKNIVNDLAMTSDCIINFAAETHVDRSIKDASLFVETDVLGTYQLLEAARKHECSYFQISTDEVYGSIVNGSFKEGDLLEPNSPYSASKTGAEMLVRAYNKTYGLNTFVTRSSNNFGPYQYPEKLIPVIILNALQNKRIPVYGDGKNIRDWIYVADNCRAIDVVLHKGKAGEVYNVGAGNEYSNIEIVHTILDILNKTHDLIEFVEDRPGHDWRYSVDTTKIRELGWTPEVDFKSGLEDTVSWYRDEYYKRSTRLQGCI